MYAYICLLCVSLRSFGVLRGLSGVASDLLPQTIKKLHRETGFNGGDFAMAKVTSGANQLVGRYGPGDYGGVGTGSKLVEAVGKERN